MRSGSREPHRCQALVKSCSYRIPRDIRLSTALFVEAPAAVPGAKRILEGPRATLCTKNDFSLFVVDKDLFIGYNELQHPNLQKLNPNQVSASADEKGIG